MDKLNKILNELNIDALLLTDYYNKRYFTGFTGSSGIALITKEKKLFFSDFRYTEQANLEIKKYGFIFIENNSRNYDIISKYIKDFGIKKIGFDNKAISYEEYKTLIKEFENILFIDSSDKLLEARMIKTDEEIENVKNAIKISEEALLETIPFIKEGISEFEIAAILEYNQRKRGASSTAFDTIVASGKRSAMPHGIASKKLIEKEEFITIDFGAYYNGYVSDITRTFYYGNNIDPRMKEIYETVKEANILGSSLLKEGIEVSEIDKKVREFMKEDAKYFGHSLGHGFGLEVHESPILSQRIKDFKLKDGMLVTIEPGIYIPEFCGVRIEDDFLITKDGAKKLTSLDKELIIINY